MKQKYLSQTKLILLFILITAAFLLPPAAQAQGTVHVVQRGETLYSIARRYGTTASALASLNGLRNPNLIYVGQRLSISGSGGGGGGATATGGVHVVQRGETLSSIALRYGTTASALASLNGLRNPNLIYVGQRLRVSGSGGSSRGGGGSTATGGVHVVRAGETLSSIALRYGTTAAAIASANGLRNANFIWVGQRLRIPSGGSSTGGGGSSSGASGGKWFEIDLSSQRMYAHQGSTVVRTMVVSTGISRYPTPPGTFRIYAKYPSMTMSGPGYYLPGVPHSMFFYKGYAIHGTYWHNNFGRPMSHGCVNLTRADAAWAYSWAPIGTLVKIHW
ncbi:MAG: LysM peptidoglycan-binding domain-containing protein [Anaerolineae bacterium]